jgi:hypothetical protein
MPNINLLQAITSATSSTFLVVSDEGVARRLNFSGISSQIEQNFTTGVRTDQNLYTTSTVQFVGQSLRGEAGQYYIRPAESIGYVFDYYNNTRANPTAIKLGDTLGSVRFGGYDGTRYIGFDRKSSVVEWLAFASEDFESSANTVTNAGSSWTINYQPPGTKLEFLSRQRIITGTWRNRAGLSLTSGNPQPATAQLIIGSGQGPTTSTNTPILSSDFGNDRYKGYGATAVDFLLATVTQIGVTEQDAVTFYGNIVDNILTVTEITTSTNNRVGVLSPGQTIQTVANLTTTNVVFDTEIVNQISGQSGGTGTYEVNILQDVPQALMFAGPDNETYLARTNSYNFNTSRRSAVPGRRNALKRGDSVGSFNFFGNDENNSPNYIQGFTARINVQATQDFSTGSHGTLMEFLTTQIADFRPRFPPTQRLVLQYDTNRYISNGHSFEQADTSNTTPMLFVGSWNDPTGAAFYANAVTISPSGTTGAKFYSNNGIGGVTLKSDGITFPDGTIQETAFNGTTSTNETIIINQPAFRVVSKPVSASAPGTPGDIFYSSTFIYLCVDTNVWRKIAIATGGVW